MEFTINIGLNNNPKNIEQLWRYMATLQGFHLIEFAERNGMYNGVPEPTFVARLRTDYSRLSKVVADIENMCSVLDQICIPIKGDAFELLVYRMNFGGEPQKFDNKYFIES